MWNQIYNIFHTYKGGRIEISIITPDNKNVYSTWLRRAFADEYILICQEIVRKNSKRHAWDN